MRVKVFMWRYRHVLGALFIAVGVLIVLRQVSPAPPGEQVTVALVDLPAGSAISSGDTTTIALPDLPAGNVADPGGQVPVVTIPAGVPVVESMLLGPGLADHAPTGTVVAPVHVADPSILELLRVGDTVDLYQAALDAGGRQGAELIAPGVLILAIPPPGQGTDAVFGGINGAEHRTFIAAIPTQAANLFTGASGLAPFRVVISSARTPT